MNKKEEMIEKMIEQNNGKYNEEIYLEIYKLCENDDLAIEKANKMFSEDKYLKLIRKIFGRRNPYIKEDGTDATLLEWFEFFLN